MTDRVLLAAMLEARAARRPVALVTAVGGDGLFAQQVGQRLVVWADPGREPLGELALGELADQVLADVRSALAARTPARAEYAAAGGSLQLFFDVQAPSPHLIIAGAGHIAVPLAAVARICDFAVSVLDDRPQYASRDRFPTADQVIAGSFTAELRRLRGGAAAFDENTYLVLVTRGHQYDVECLLEVLDDPVAYIGMIGSQRRIRAVYQLLEREQGIPAEKFERIHAPIGIDINAQTPAEIAVAIMAEIINVQRGGAAPALSDYLRQRGKKVSTQRRGQPVVAGAKTPRE
jgi:xanthine dehydrogenase accessory factor